MLEVNRVDKPDPEGVRSAACVGLMYVAVDGFGQEMREEHAEFIVDADLRARDEQVWDSVADKIEDEYTTLRALADYLRRHNPHRRDDDELQKRLDRINEEIK